MPTTAAKSLGSRPTLRNPVPGMLQARTLEWVATSFSSAWKWSHSVLSDSSGPHGLQPTRLLRPWDFPGKSTGVGCQCLLRMLTTGAPQRKSSASPSSALPGAFRECSHWLPVPPSQTWMDSQGRQGVWGKSLIWYRQQKPWNQRKQRWYRETTSNEYPPRGGADCIQRARTGNHSEKKEKTGNTKALLKIKKRKKKKS